MNVHFKQPLNTTNQCENIAKPRHFSELVGFCGFDRRAKAFDTINQWGQMAPKLVDVCQYINQSDK